MIEEITQFQDRMDKDGVALQVLVDNQRRIADALERLMLARDLVRFEPPPEDHRQAVAL